MINKGKLRGKLFRHLDGLVTAPVLIALYDADVISYITGKKQVNLQNLVKEFSANEGYMNVALRVLCSQGLLIQKQTSNEGDIQFSLTAKGAILFANVEVYKGVVALMKMSGNFHPRKFEIEPFQALNVLFNQFKNKFELNLIASELECKVQEEILAHIEGCLVGPTLVHLGMSGMFHKYFMETSFRPDEFHEDPESFKKLLDFLAYLGWFTEKNGTYEFTETGLFFAKRASAYGVTVSYMPTFRNLDILLFGNPESMRSNELNSDEIHVDREMNVWGSGGAHSNYFKVVDEIILELFNKPIEEQPKGILDMGCGNGAFLEHLFTVIERQTIRGSVLDSHPLFLVGADFNQAALKVTRRNLIKADIWAKIIWGDIGQPDLLATNLKENYNIDLSELLNVRTFLDHNRIWHDPENIDSNRLSLSSGAFAHRGRRIENRFVEDNLLEHMNKWAPYVRKFGLLLIELHTVSPDIVARSLGKTAATAYDATHGFSDQYILEIEVFHKVCAEAGLISDENVFTKFPNSELATVSINLLKGS